MKKQFIFLVLFSALIFGSTAPFVANATENELNTTLNLTGWFDVIPVPTINVQSNTTYTYTVSLTSNISPKVPIVLIKPRLPDPFVMGGPIVCPSGWPAGHLGNNSEGIGSVVCIEPGLDTTVPNPTSNPQYDLLYGQTGNVSFTFTTPSSGGTTDLALYINYIRSDGTMQGIWYSPAVHIVVESPVCTSWTYSDWSSCSSSGNQTRSVISSSPNGCTGGSPVINQSCTYTPPVPSCTATNWACGNWGACSQNGSQSRICDKNVTCQGGVSSPATSQSCTYVAPVPSCTSFNYSGWSECTPDGKQTRNVTSKYPSNCEGGESPKTTQSCTYTPSCTADVWTCGAWGSCSLSGIQNRSCTKTFDCPNVQTAPPTTDQYCEAPSRPAQQAPQEGSDIISNQDVIIRSTVKLLCPVDAQKASQGSGTIIDSNGTILTNKHVIAGTLGCLVGFISDFNDEPYFGERQIADITKVSPNQDIAILKIRNPQNKTLPNVDITKGNSNLRLGIKITTYGFPAKFGTKVTYTSGDFSGTDGNYIKTTAILEYGNSGGGAYLKDGTFIGIPSAVVRGELNALGYILSVNTINSWLGNSSITYGGTNNNNYSRVSVLEDIDLNKLDALKLFIPDTDTKGNLVAPTMGQSAQKTAEQPKNNQIQKESTIIESADTNQKINPEQNNSASSEKKPEEEKGGDSSVNILEQRRSTVANAVQEMVKVAERNGGVGQEIKTIAQAQTQNQEKLETGLQKIQNRGGFARFFIGPNYGEIKESQKLLERNKEQIQKLNKLRAQVIDQKDQQQIAEQIQILGQTTQEIENTLNEAQKGFSLFGWMFRLFTK